MIEINLIPDVKQELLRAQSTRAAVITIAIFTSIASGVLVVLLLGYIFGVQLVRDTLAQQDIDKYSKELSSVEDLSEILTIQNQLANIDGLNDNKKITSRVFDMLAAVIPPDPNSVQVSDMNIDTEAKTIRIEGQTRGFDSMEVFKKTLDNAILVYVEEGENVEQKLADSITISDTSYGDVNNVKVLRFNLTFAYGEQLFSPAISSMQFKLKVDGNVTDSYLGIPKSIFGERAKDIEE